MERCQKFSLLRFILLAIILVVIAVLYAPFQMNNAVVLGEYKQVNFLTEKHLNQKIQNILEPMFGSGNITVSSSVASALFTSSQLEKEMTEHLSVSVVINGTPKHHQIVEYLIKSAIGFNPMRGDQVMVAYQPVRMEKKLNWPWKNIGLGVLVGIGLILLFWPVSPKEKKENPVVLTPTVGKKRSVFDEMADLDPKETARFLQKEMPEVAAVALTQIKATQAANVLNQMDVGVARQIVQAMYHVQNISPDVLQSLSQTIKSDLIEPALTQQFVHRNMKDLLENLKPDIIQNMRENIEREEVKSISKLMFNIEDLTTFSPMEVKKVLTLVDRYQLAVALRGASDEVAGCVERVLDVKDLNLLRMQRQNLGMVLLKDIDEAQDKIVKIMKDIRDTK